jgi:ribosomal-protein-alanine N-acetyltransferase
MKLKLRHGTSDDALLLTDLDGRCFPPHIAYDLPTFEDICEHAKSIVVAEVEGRVVGFAAADINDDEPVALLITIDVDPDWRRQGVGSRLLQETHARLATLGATTIYLHVAVRSADAQRLYKRHGYSNVGRLRDYYGPHDDAFVMARALDDKDV